MKKTYFAPAVKVVKIQTQHMFAASGDPQNITLTIGGDNISSSNDIGSKGGESLWDDED